MAKEKPNILIVMADQLAPHFTGAYGHPVVKTPQLDELANRGMRFDAAYCNSPLCAPSRFAFMSGQLISRIAAYDNASEFCATVPTFAHYVKALGYRTCLSGKMHFVGPDQKHGFEDREQPISIHLILPGHLIGKRTMSASISGTTICRPSRKAAWRWRLFKSTMTTK